MRIESERHLPAYPLTWRNGFAQAASDARPCVITSYSIHYTKLYETVMSRMAREHLNLLYVAWTRAEDELYGFLPAKSPRGPSPVLSAAALVLGDIPPGEASERGTRPAPGPAFAPPAQPTPRDLPRRDGPPDIMAWLPRLRVYRHAVEESVDRLAA